MIRSKSNPPGSSHSKSPFSGRQVHHVRFGGKRQASSAVNAMDDTDVEMEEGGELAAASGAPWSNTPAKKPKTSSAGGAPKLQQVTGQPVQFHDGSSAQWKIKKADGYFLLGADSTASRELLSKRGGFTDQIRRELHERGICWYCKKEGHGASTCPNTSKQGTKQGTNKGGK